LTLTTGDEKLLNMSIRYEGLFPLPSQMTAIVKLCLPAGRQGDIFARPTPRIFSHLQGDKGGLDNLEWEGKKNRCL